MQLRLNRQQREAHSLSSSPPTAFVSPCLRSLFYFFPLSPSLRSLFSLVLSAATVFASLRSHVVPRLRVVCEGDGDCDGTDGETSTVGPLFGYRPISGR